VLLAPAPKAVTLTCRSRPPPTRPRCTATRAGRTARGQPGRQRRPAQHPRRHRRCHHRHQPRPRRAVGRQHRPGYSPRRDRPPLCRDPAVSRKSG
jgi:hypothetical protein